MDKKVNKFSMNNIKRTVVTHKIKEVKGMKQNVKQMVETLLEKAKDSRALPDYGDFSPLYTEFKNPNSNLCATDFMLKIVKPHNSIEGHETKRNLELVAYKLPSPYIAERLLASGTTEEILEALKDPALLEKITTATESLSKSLEDV